MSKENVNSFCGNQRNNQKWRPTCTELGVSYLQSFGFSRKVKKVIEVFKINRAGYYIGRGV